MGPRSPNSSSSSTKSFPSAGFRSPTIVNFPRITVPHLEGLSSPPPLEVGETWMLMLHSSLFSKLLFISSVFVAGLFLVPAGIAAGTLGKDRFSNGWLKAFLICIFLSKWYYIKQYYKICLKSAPARSNG